MLPQLLHVLWSPDVAMRLGPLQFSTVETALLAMALVTATSSAAGLWRISFREDRQERLKLLQQAAAAREAVEDVDDGSARQSRLVALVMRSPFVRLLGRERLRQALMNAGHNGDHWLAIVIACKFAGALGFPASYWWLGLSAGNPLLRWTIAALCAFIGFFLPEILLSRQAARRKRRLEHAIPDALDLLVICAEAGLAMQPALDEVAQTLQRASPEIAAEFAFTSAELRVLPDRATALENLVKRTGIESLRSVIATLNQSIRFGSSLSESLRVLNGEMRAARIAHLEEAAARLPVLLAIPLMLFLMPALLIVIMSPVALKVIDVIATSNIGH